MPTKKYIASIRYHRCCSDPNKDTHYWKVIEHPSSLRLGERYSADCDSLSGGSQCDDCGEWIEKLERFSPQRAKELGLEDRLQQNRKD